MRFFVKILAFCLAGFLAGSCYEDPDCIDLRSDYVGFTFKKLFDKQVDTVAVVGITTSGTDSVFYQFTNVAGPIRLPLNVAASSQSFAFDLAGGPHALEVGYEAKPQFESVTCGPRFVLTHLNVPSHSFDSVRVTNPVAVGSETGSNIDIYRCPITNNFKISFRQWYADDNANGVSLTERLHGVRLDYLPFTYYPGAEVGAVVVPLNLSGTGTNILIDSKASGLSNLEIGYKLETANLLAVCGTQVFVKNIEVNGTSGYDFIRVQKDSITDPPTTNIAMFRCPQTNLIELQLAGAPQEGIRIKKVTAGYTPEIFYQDSLATTLVLPLDGSQAATSYSIEFEAFARHITFGYNRTLQAFHGKCAQTLFSDVQVLSSDFTTPPVVKNDSIQFPSVVNFEIAND